MEITEEKKVKHFFTIKKGFFQNSAFIRNSAVLFFGSISVGVLNYVFHLVLGRQVSVEVYGEAESLISLIAIIAVPATTLSMVATKYSASCKADNDRAGSRTIWVYLNKKVLTFGFPVFLLLILATPLIGRFLNIENIWALISVWIVMYVSFFDAVNNGFLSGWQKFKKLSFVGIISTGMKLLSAIVLIGAGFALNGIVGSLILASVMTYIVTFMMLHIDILKKSNDDNDMSQNEIDFISLRKYVFPVFVGNLAIAILSNADMVLAKHSLSTIEAGQYGALTVVSKIIFFATGAMSSVLFSMSSEHTHRQESSRHILKTALFCVLGASLLATFLYFSYPSVILSILYGGKYTAVAPHLGWFAVAVTLFSLSNIMYQYLLSKHKTNISYALLTISLFMVLFILIFGESIGAIISIVILTQVIAMALGVFFLLRRRK